jgi:DNA-binding MarR family transcriptional regulator
MQTGQPSREVEALLHDHIESYEQLELLLLMRGDREALWTAEALSARLHMHSSLVQAALDRLESAGFIEVRAAGIEKRHAYLGQSDNVEATISQLAAGYRENPIPIIKLMSANAIERLRTGALRTFADAFILRKGKYRG